jgi:hypothetical protein
MKHTSILAARGQTDQVSLARALDQLVRDEIARSVSVDAMVAMHDGGIAGLASLANASSVAEGRLLEKVIALIAESNPNLSVFAQVRLPVREDALELVEKNPEALYRGLTLDANARTRKSYIADLIILNRLTRLAHVVDIKRSLGSSKRLASGPTSGTVSGTLATSIILLTCRVLLIWYGGYGRTLSGSPRKTFRRRASGCAKGRRCRRSLRSLSRRRRALQRSGLTPCPDAHVLRARMTQTLA